MNRKQKEQEVTHLRQLMQDANATFLINYQGLSVSQVQTLRRSLREDNGVFRVSKARLMKLAADGQGENVDSFRDTFGGQVGLVFALSEVPAVAKKLMKFAKTCESLEVVSGYFEESVLSSQQVKHLATIPSREELLAQVASVLQAPIASFARVLNAPMVQLAGVVDALAKKK